MSSANTPLTAIDKNNVTDVPVQQDKIFRAMMDIRHAVPKGEQPAIDGFFMLVGQLATLSDRIIATKQAAAAARQGSAFEAQAARQWGMLVRDVSDHVHRVTYAEAALENTRRGSLFDQEIHRVLRETRPVPIVERPAARRGKVRRLDLGDV